MGPARRNNKVEHALVMYTLYRRRRLAVFGESEWLKINLPTRIPWFSFDSYIFGFAFLSFIKTRNTLTCTMFNSSYVVCRKLDSSVFCLKMTLSDFFLRFANNTAILQLSTYLFVLLCTFDIYIFPIAFLSLEIWYVCVFVCFYLFGWAWFWLALFLKHLIWLAFLHVFRRCRKFIFFVVMSPRNSPTASNFKKRPAFIGFSEPTP